MNAFLHDSRKDQVTEYVTVTIAGQLFGLPIDKVHDVFVPDRLTRVPLAPAEVAGVLNLRGRIVTAIAMRRRLKLPAREEGPPAMAVGIDWRGESYGLLVDAVGEVLKLSDATREPNPANLDPQLVSVSAGIHRLDDQLLLILDVDHVFGAGVEAVAA
jgi:purine-binding chemotaxis protein CheW